MPVPTSKQLRSQKRSLRKPCKAGKVRSMTTKRCRSPVKSGPKRGPGRPRKSGSRSRRKPCAQGSIRSRTTGRCRKVLGTRSRSRRRPGRPKGSKNKPRSRSRAATMSSRYAPSFESSDLRKTKRSLRKPCKEGKVRSMKTKRCRSPMKRGPKRGPGRPRKSGSRSRRKPCAQGKVRSRSTGRCRNLLGTRSRSRRRPGRPKGSKNKATSPKKPMRSRRKPCAQGSIRSRTTGRCRKVLGTRSRSRRGPGRPKGSKNKPRSRARAATMSSYY